MTKNGVIILIVAAVVFTVVGFFIGQAATALIDPPGSDGDPLVTQSYVEALVGERTAEDMKIKIGCVFPKEEEETIEVKPIEVDVTRKAKKPRPKKKDTSKKHA